MKKNELLFLGVIVSCVGCLGPKKINKGVEAHYSPVATSNVKPKSDYLSITSPLTNNDAPLSTTVKTSKNLLPLLFYWQCDYYLTCTMNPKIPVNTCASAIRTYAGSKGLKQKLNNAKIEISIDSVPNVFALFERDHMVWVIYAFTWIQQSFTPQHSDLVISYKVSGSTDVTKAGQIIIPDNSKSQGIRYLESIKRAEDEYLDQYDDNLRTMSKKAVDELIKQLQ